MLILTEPVFVCRAIIPIKNWKIKCLILVMISIWIKTRPLLYNELGYPHRLISCLSWIFYPCERAKKSRKWIVWLWASLSTSTSMRCSIMAGRNEPCCIWPDTYLPSSAVHLTPSHINFLCSLDSFNSSISSSRSCTNSGGKTRVLAPVRIASNKLLKKSAPQKKK